MKTTIDGFGEGLAELAKQREDVVVISADAAASQFADKYPNRFIRIGQNMLGVAVGMAQEGKIPFVSSCVGLGKNWDQLRVLCHNNENVKIADFDENMLEDIALTRALPNITIIIPADYQEAKKATLAAGTMKGPFYLKLGKEKAHVTTEKTPFTIGRAEIMRAGKDCTIIACGSVLHEALLAAEKLSKQEIECTVLDCHTVQPIDRHAIISSARLTGCIVTAEQATKGGLGSAVAEVLSQNTPVPLRMIGVGNDVILRICKAVKEVVLQRCETVCTAIQEEHGRKLYAEIQPELHFRLQGGGVIKSIPGLKKALLDMSDEAFSHHCNNHKNDFSTWVKDAFKEPVLAKHLEKTHTRIGMALTITRWLT